MAHLHLHARFVGQFFQGVGLFGRGHDGLLNEDMLVFPQSLRGALEMADGRSHNVDHIHPIYQCINGIETLHIQFVLHLLRRFLGRVEKPDQVVSLYMFDAVQVDFPQMTCA